MEYTPGRVYRHKRRVGKKYRARARNFEPLLAACSVACAIAFVALFVNLWII